MQEIGLRKPDAGDLRQYAWKACMSRKISSVANATALASLALCLNGDYDFAVQANQSVEVKDKETGVCAFTFAPPMARDAAGHTEIAEVALGGASGLHPADLSPERRIPRQCKLAHRHRPCGQDWL